MSGANPPATSSLTFLLSAYIILHNCSSSWPCMQRHAHMCRLLHGWTCCTCATTTQGSPQRADVFCEGLRKHIDAPLHQVHCGGPAGESSSSSRMGAGSIKISCHDETAEMARAREKDQGKVRSQGKGGTEPGERRRKARGKAASPVERRQAQGKGGTEPGGR